MKNKLSNPLVLRLLVASFLFAGNSSYANEDLVVELKEIKVRAKRDSDTRPVQGYQAKEVAPQQKPTLS